MTEFFVRAANCNRRIGLGPEFHDDMDFWRWLASDGLSLLGGRMFDHAYHLLDRMPARSWFSDASASAVGGFCAETGMWWRYDLTPDQCARVRGHQIHHENDISMNILELLGVVMSAWLMVVLLRETPEGTTDCVLLRGDDKSAVQWIKKCRGGNEARGGALMRYLGVLEIASGYIYIYFFFSAPNTSQVF